MSGSTPFTLPLTASVAGMPAGSTRDGTLTLTGSAPGQNDQVIAIPVHLTMGAVYDAPPPTAAYLRLLKK